MGSLQEWLTVAIAGGGVSAGLYQYWRAERWKRLEWIGREVQAFRSEPLVQNALWMLDWRERELPLILPAQQSGATFDYDQYMLVHALSSESSPQTKGYEDAEFCIRDSFDRFFAGLELFESFVASGLVSKEELAPHLEYWIEVLADPENPMKAPEVRERILSFMKDYEYTGSRKLIERFGWSV